MASRTGVRLVPSADAISSSFSEAPGGRSADMIRVFRYRYASSTRYPLGSSERVPARSGALRGRPSVEGVNRRDERIVFSLYNRRPSTCQRPLRPSLGTSRPPHGETEQTPCRGPRRTLPRRSGEVTVAAARDERRLRAAVLAGFAQRCSAARQLL